MKWTRIELTEEELNNLYETMQDIKNGEYESATFFSGEKTFVVDGRGGITRRIYIWEMIDYDNI